MKKYSTIIAFLSILFLWGCESENNNTSEASKVQVIQTFNKERHAFGDTHQQAVEKVFDFQVEPAEVSSISMFIKLDCPEGGCNAWDVFANVRIWDEDAESWYEMGRYITPYGVDNNMLKDGFKIDVTDFKPLLTGEVRLKSFVEVWGNDGWLVSIDFKIEKGEPDYKYYALAEIIDFADHSLAGVPYGEDHDFCLEKQITMPDNTRETDFRTIITGWGHATPIDDDQRPCAEWCFRTHTILIDDAPFFFHDMKPLGCASNPVQPQNGNWAPDRAGWCPGMEVPVRTNSFEDPLAGETIRFSYEFEDWTNDFQSSADNQHAYYAISSYVVVKSDSPIESPLIQKK